MSERKLVRNDLSDIAPNNSEKAARSRVIRPADTKNSDKENIKRQKLAPIVKGPVVQQKPSFWQKAKGALIGESGNIGEWILYDVLIPSFRNTMADMGCGIVESIFGAGTSSRGRDYGPRVIRDRGRSYVSYNDVSRGRGSDRREIDRGDRVRHEFSNIIYTRRGEAEDVLAHLVDMTIEYGEATVAAFYELSNIESTYADSNYGWTNLRDAYTEQVRGGYVIRFPQVRPL